MTEHSSTPSAKGASMGDRYTIRYQAGPYSGTRTVLADNEDHAIAKVRAEVRRSMSLPMYSESYRIEAVGEGGEHG